MDVLLFGPQGSGKGTQAKRIAAEYGIPHIATGDILRAAIDAETSLGLEVKAIVDRGDLVPDALMTGIIRDRLGESDASGGFILDGFPRTMPQAEALDGMLGEISRSLDIVLEFQLADEVCVERMLNRAREEGRSDDTPEVIERRLALYHEQTEPLAEYYRLKGILVGIHADAPVDAVFGEISEALNQVEVAAT